MKLRRRVARVESLVGKELALCKRRRVTHTLPARRDSRKILPILRLLLLDLSNFNRTVIGRLGSIGRRPKNIRQVSLLIKIIIFVDDLGIIHVDIFKFQTLNCHSFFGSFFFTSNTESAFLLLLNFLNRIARVLIIVMAVCVHFLILFQLQKFKIMDLPSLMEKDYTLQYH